MPERIQLRRTKGWRKPEGAIVVARPSLWGNPFKVGDECQVSGLSGDGTWYDLSGLHLTAGLAVELFEMDLLGEHECHLYDRAHGEPPEESRLEAARRVLRGKDLACWCPLDQPCHADVLLELANR